MILLEKVLKAEFSAFEARGASRFFTDDTVRAINMRLTILDFDKRLQETSAAGFAYRKVAAMFGTEIVCFKLSGELRHGYLAGFLRRDVEPATAAVLIERRYHTRRTVIHFENLNSKPSGRKSSKKV